MILPQILPPGHPRSSMLGGHLRTFLDAGDAGAALQTFPDAGARRSGMGVRRCERSGMGVRTFLRSWCNSGDAARAFEWAGKMW